MRCCLPPPPPALSWSSSSVRLSNRIADTQQDGWDPLVDFQQPQHRSRQALRGVSSPEQRRRDPAAEGGSQKHNRAQPSGRRGRIPRAAGGTGCLGPRAAPVEGTAVTPALSHRMLQQPPCRNPASTCVPPHLRPAPALVFTWFVENDRRRDRQRSGGMGQQQQPFPPPC